MPEYAVVLITASSQEEAQKIARTMVEERLFACTNIIFPIQSIYHWQGKICDDKEALIIAKTKMALFPSVVRRVKELHSYKVPEVLFLPVMQGLEDYLNWIAAETRTVIGQNDK
ncbi:MAG TPA: divalent-cation tolerance protein CutA [Candidatus Hypogeohydataceae bacterium YC41]